MADNSLLLLLDALARTEIQLLGIAVDSPHYAQAQLTLASIEDMRCQLLGKEKEETSRDGKNDNPLDTTKPKRGRTKGRFLKPEIKEEEFLGRLRRIIDAAFCPDSNMCRLNNKLIPPRRFTALVYSMCIEHSFAIEQPSAKTFHQLLLQAISDAPYREKFTLAYNTFSNGLKEWGEWIGRNKYDEMIPLHQVSIEQASTLENRRKLSSIKTEYSSLLQLARNQEFIPKVKA